MQIQPLRRQQQLATLDLDQITVGSTDRRTRATRVETLRPLLIEHETTLETTTDILSEGSVPQLTALDGAVTV
jgi:hypothetical protein